MLTGDMLRRSAARFPDKPAIIFRGPEGVRRVLLYRELDARANQLTHALLALGLACTLLHLGLPRRTPAT